MIYCAYDKIYLFRRNQIKKLYRFVITFVIVWVFVRLLLDFILIKDFTYRVKITEKFKPQTTTIFMVTNSFLKVQNKLSFLVYYSAKDRGGVIDYVVKHRKFLSIYYVCVWCVRLLMFVSAFVLFFFLSAWYCESESPKFGFSFFTQPQCEQDSVRFHTKLLFFKFCAV